MEIVDEMMVVFANHRLTYWNMYLGSVHRVACTCAWDSEEFKDPWQANKAAGKHLAEQVEHLVRAEVTEALEAHEEAKGILSEDQYEYCVEYDPYAKFSFKMPDRPAERSRWSNVKRAKAFFEEARVSGYQPKFIKRIKPGPEEIITKSA